MTSINTKQFVFIIIGVLSLNFVADICQAQNGNGKITSEEYITTYKDFAIKEMHQFKIPASITIAQGLLESANGNSDLAIHAKNHFGIKCHLDWEGPGYYKDDDAKNECFRVYDNPQESFRDHSLFLKERSRYAFLFDLNPMDYKAWAHGLKKAGYATEPSYAYMLINLIEKNELHIFDQVEDTVNLIAYQKPPEEGEKQFPVSGKTLASYEDDFEAVNINSKDRSIKQNNGVDYIVAIKGDTPEKIAKDMDMMPWEIRNYNDLTRIDPILDGQFIYIQPKKKKAEGEFYTVQNHDTMYSISQKFAIKLKHLYKKNDMVVGSEPLSGQRLKLR
ncbi:glucosaminidase domain-containing protein [candidate division KSB1 bacterium]